MGTPEKTAKTQAFIYKVAEGNGLEMQEQLVDRDDILQERTLLSDYNFAVEPYQPTTKHLGFEHIIDLEL